MPFGAALMVAVHFRSCSLRGVSIVVVLFGFLQATIFLLLLLPEMLADFLFYFFSARHELVRLQHDAMLPE